MPEGPEVRRYADTLHEALQGKKIVSLTARTKTAKAWLAEHPHVLAGRHIDWVRSRGKNLVGLIEGGYYFYVHLLMWGSWRVFASPPEERDRRERACLTVEAGTTAVLFSAPVFEVGKSLSSDPFSEHPYLRELGPDVIPYPGEGGFSASCFQERMHLPENLPRSLGAVLLDQTVAAGIGNYLRAEILFACGLNPFRTVSSLSEQEERILSQQIAAVSMRAYTTGGVSIPSAVRDRVRQEPRLRYPNASDEWGTRHWVFRRTNLPCLVCGRPIRQKKQVTWQTDDGEKERIIYFCPICQRVAE